jgi:hypothetical protein
VKRSTIGSAQANYILGSAQAPSGTNGVYLGFGSDTLFFGDYATSGWDWYLQSSSLYRDMSAWYHVVAQYDSTQATASERAKLYVNGVRLTAFDGASTYPGPSADSRFNQASVEMAIGRLGTYNGNYFNGYIAEVQFIDGQALTPSSFGETDATTGRWKAKAYTGTYGVNGFYLNFADNSGATATTLGKDSAPISGAHTTANNWTPNNLSVTPGTGNDSFVDSPTNFGSISTTLVNDTYQISKSLRFNSADLAYLSRTPASAGNRKTWTWSGWVKRGTLGGNNVFMGNVDSSGYNGIYFQFDTSNNLTIGDYGVGSYVWVLTTSQVFRDTSAWYHIVASFDSTQSTASDRVSIYINGAKITSFSTATYPSLNLDGRINSTQLTAIGRLGSYNGFYFDGYMAEVNFIDGQALTPSSFGTRDINTYLWKPKAYTGTYGTNGFYLNFSDSSNTTATTLGKDQAGSNNWTPNNFSVTAGPGNDSLVDSPTYYGTDSGAGGEARGDYATMDPAYPGSVLSNGNLRSTASFANSTLRMTSGKYYFEATPTTSTLVDSNSYYVGVTGGSAFCVYALSGNRFNGTAWVAFASPFASGDVIGVAVDISAGTVSFYKNNVLQGTQTMSANQAVSAFSSISASNTGSTFDFNFGQRAFGYAPPAGSKVLRDYNKLPVPTGGEVRGNYATLNPLFGNIGGIITDGNLTLTHTGGANSKNALGVSSIAMSTGKWYCEFTNTAATTSDRIGIISSANNSIVTSGNPYFSQYADGYSAFVGGGTFRENNNTSSAITNFGGSSPVVNDIYMVALDLDNNKVWFGRNGSWANSGNPASGTTETYSILSGRSYYFACNTYLGDQLVANFGQRPWAYDAPFGFLPLCTTLLPQPIVQKSSSYFDAVAFTATNSAGSVSSLSFQPDLTWIKDRDSTIDHFLHDSIRGYGNSLSSNTTGLSTAGGGITSQLSNGFNYAIGNTNRWISWSWDAGSSSVSNTSGSITSTVRANPQAGFSVCTFNVGASGAKTFGHGLSTAPRMVIVKSRTSALGWCTYHASVISATNQYLQLNTTATISSVAGLWGSALPTSSVVGVGSGTNVNVNDDCVAYCFSEVEGFSKFGSYTGNGSADGPFVWCGFRPKYLLIKDATNVNNWEIIDTSRDTYNIADKSLLPNLANAEGTAGVIDILSNGFKNRFAGGIANTSGATVIFAAFAEAPFKYARAR